MTPWGFVYASGDLDYASAQPARHIRAGMRIAACGFAVLGLATSCALIPSPSLGTAPEECIALARGAELAWVGHGYPEEAGLTEWGNNQPPVKGDIFVEVARPSDWTPEDGGLPERAWCLWVPSRGQPGSIMGDFVPEGWEPP